MITFFLRFKLAGETLTESIPALSLRMAKDRLELYYSDPYAIEDLTNQTIDDVN